MAGEPHIKLRAKIRVNVFFKSNPYFLVFIERNFLAAPVIEICGAR